MTLVDLLFMRNNNFILPIEAEIKSIMIILLPLSICIGIFTAHLVKESFTSVLFNLLGCVFLSTCFIQLLDSAVDIGGDIGQKFISRNNSIIKDWKQESGKKDINDMFKKSELKVDSAFSIEFSVIKAITDYVTSNWIIWILFVLSIINTVAFALAKNVYLILLSISVIPMFYKIQRTLFLYIMFCFLLPICIGAILGVFDYMITDDLDQFHIFLQLAFGVGFLVSLAFSKKYVYSILAGDGISQTVSTAGQSIANMTTSWLIGAGITYTISKPRDYLARKAVSFGSRSIGKARSGFKNRGEIVGKTLDKNSVSYAAIANKEGSSIKGTSSNSVVNAISKTVPSEMKSIQSYAQRVISNRPDLANKPFSYHDYKNWSREQQKVTPRTYRENSKQVQVSNHSQIYNRQHNRPSFTKENQGKNVGKNQSNLKNGGRA